MALSANKVTRAKLDQCLRLYPDVVRKAYESRIKDAKKREEAKARDDWRYDELPKALKGGKAMSLAQLERLVQWKITHGQSRPFLPAMIRKNAAGAVTEATSAAAKLLAPLKPSTAVQAGLDITLSALEAACKLTGVGPATGALVLSVYDPENTPFFQDELFMWCLPEKANAKLKYDKKEYGELFKRVSEVRKRLGSNTSLVELEKASFVLQHFDLLDESARQSLEGAETKEATGATDEAAAHATPDASGPDVTVAKKSSKRNSAVTKRKDSPEVSQPETKRRKK